MVGSAPALDPPLIRKPSCPAVIPCDRSLLSVRSTPPRAVRRSTPTARRAKPGSLSVNLVLADGIRNGRKSSSQITGERHGRVGDVDVSAPGSTASVEVFGLPPGRPTTVTLTATSTVQRSTCQGSAPFNVEVGQSTDVMVMLNCKKPRTLGVRVNGKFNVRAAHQGGRCRPCNLSRQRRRPLGAGVQREGNPIPPTSGPATAARCRPHRGGTTYTCQEVGDHTVTIMVTDDDVYCRIATWTIPVTCVEGDGGDLYERRLRRRRQRCTASDCNPATARVRPATLPTARSAWRAPARVASLRRDDLCDGVDYNDNNSAPQMTVIRERHLHNTNVDDGTPCSNDEGVCTDGSCVDVNLLRRRRL